MKNGLERIRLLCLRDKVMSAEQAIEFIQHGAVVGLSGFGGAGEAKSVPLALADHAQQHPLKITLVTGASLGNKIDGRLSAVHAIQRRYPYQADPEILYWTHDWLPTGFICRLYHFRVTHSTRISL